MAATNHQTGKLAEEIAANLLRLKGWRILEKRWQPGRGSGGGEIDLIAARGGLLAFVEVKHRDDLATAAESVTARQRQRIARAAEIYLGHFPQYGEKGVRFDVILLAPGKVPKHIKDAWRLES